FGSAIFVGIVALAATMALHSPAVGAAPNPEAALDAVSLERLRKLAILDNNRVKPFDTFAREAVKVVTGSSAVDGQDPVITVLSWASHPDVYAQQPLIKVKYERVLKLQIGIAEGTEKVSYESLNYRGNAQFREVVATAGRKSEKEITTLDTQ